MSSDNSSPSELLELNSCKRSIELYLRALWGRGFAIRYADVEKGSVISYFYENKIYLPVQVSVKQEQSRYYRAAATHAASHSVYGGAHFERADFNLMQRSIVGLVEDLRVELLAIKQFPGLRKLWLGLHPHDLEHAVNAQNLMVRLSRSVLAPAYEDTHLWVKKGKRLILDAADKLHDPAVSLHTGLQLANDMGQMRLPLNSGRYEQAVLYRDDNRCLWQEVIDSRQQADAVKSNEVSTNYKKRLREESKGVQINLADKAGDYGEGFDIRQKDGADFEFRQQRFEEKISSHVYPEWDYRTHIFKKGWCTLTESKSSEGSMAKVAEIFDAHKVTLMRLRHIAKRLLTVKRQRIRKIEDGDDIDLDPMINAMVSVRVNEMPDTRVFMREAYHQTKSLAVLILLDLSESTNELVSGANVSMSQLMRDAVLLLGETLSIADEHFAIFGFSSNGRHQVQVTNFKKFTEPFTETKARLASINGQYSTRLGAAIRHSEQYLARQMERKKLLLVITDGAPSDIDVYDQRYLEHDSWHAVHELSKSGIKPFCLNLDAGSDRVIEHIFGRGRFETLEHLTRLPEVLSGIYLKYARH
jgi:nitric oxide reductase NorD protein